MAQDHYDDIIIGGGKAGKTLAPALVAAGRRTALVELAPERIGGSCINVACIPTKTLLASAETARVVRHAAAYGIGAGPTTVDASQVGARKRAVVEAMRVANRDILDRSLGADLIFGEARFTGPKAVEVWAAEGLRTLTADRVFINTGTRPSVPEVEGLARSGYLTSETLLDLQELPEHLVVIGGGFIALEFAYLYRQLGSRVTLLVRGSQVLPRVDGELAARVLAHLKDEGIDVHLRAAVHRVNPGPVVQWEGPGGGSLEASHLLVATGRVPNTEALSLDAAGVQTDSRGFIVVNHRLETSVPSIWALGDVNGGPQFTHAALDDFRIVKANLIDGGDRSTRDRLVPSCLFLEPELAHVGLPEDQVRASGRPYLVARLEASQIPRAKTLGRTEGLLKALVGADDRILGCTLFCHGAGEMISTVQLAMTAGLPYTALRDAVLTHPTMTEGLNLLFGRLTLPDPRGDEGSAGR